MVFCTLKIMSEMDTVISHILPLIHTHKCTHTHMSTYNILTHICTHSPKYPKYPLLYTHMPDTHIYHTCTQLLSYINTPILTHTYIITHSPISTHPFSHLHTLTTHTCLHTRAHIHRDTLHPHPPNEVILGMCAAQDWAL